MCRNIHLSKKNQEQNDPNYVLQINIPMSMRRTLHIHDPIIYSESVSSNDPFNQQQESDSSSNNDVYSSF